MPPIRSQKRRVNTSMERFVFWRIPPNAFALCKDQRERDNVQHMTLAFLESSEFTKAPRIWQLQAALRILRKKDLLVIAGTSAGKTAAMCLPLYVLREKVAIFIEPLISLQNTMAEKIEHEFGLDCAVVNSEVEISDNGWKRIISHKQVIITSPEQLSVTGTRAVPALLTLLMTNRKLRGRLAYVAVDEAHKVYQWGVEDFGKGIFRPAFGKLDDLRGLLPPGTPMLALSGSLPPLAEKTLFRKLQFIPEKTERIQLTINRPDIAFGVVHARGPIGPPVLDFLVIPTINNLLVPLPRGIVFVSKLADARIWAEHLQQLLPREMKAKVGFVHAKYSKEYKDRTVAQFSVGKIDIIISTSMLSTGLDFVGVEFVVKVGIVYDLIDVAQEFGRAARGVLAVRAWGLLIAEEWVHRAVVMKRARDDEGGDETVYKKVELPKKKPVKKEVHKEVKADATAVAKKSGKPRATPFPVSIPKSQQVSVSSFDFTNTSGCRRLVIRRYLGDIGQIVPELEWCCDNCHPDVARRWELLTRLMQPPSLSTPVKRQPLAPSLKRQYRPVKHREALEEQLVLWRLDQRKALGLGSFHPLSFILPTALFSKIAMTPPGTSKDELAAVAGRGAPWANMHGNSLVLFLASYDQKPEVRLKKTKVEPGGTSASIEVCAGDAETELGSDTDAEWDGPPAASVRPLALNI